VSAPLLIFDMDGVLVDVTESYRETIVRTVEHFTGVAVGFERIQDLKNQGGWNDDWKLSHHLAATLGASVTLQEATDYFQGIFHGDGSDGLMLRERWIDRTGTLERLAARYRFAVFTGRQKWEAELTLHRSAPHLVFDPIVGMYEVENPKPAPDGLLLLAAASPGCPLWYVGDTVDDARCARAAGVPFIGIAAPVGPRHAELVRLLGAERAVAVLDDINALETVLP
jgi:HAD superfamily phosphatase